MKAWSLLLVRLSIGLLLVLWGLDKLFNVEHSVRVAEGFYWGIGSSATVLNVLGAAETLLGVMVLLGWQRRWAYPVTIAILGVTALGVWKSIVDPWGWVLEGTNVLFYPSLIVLAAALMLQAFRDEDRMALDAR